MTGQVIALPRALPVVHDLPPSWDGAPITWNGWAEGRTSMVFHAKQEPCRRCGIADEAKVNIGRRTPEEGATFTVPSQRARLLERAGRRVPRGETEEVPAWPVTDLIAYRCRGCGLDHVHDQRTDEWWELDISDYRDKGSTDVEGALW